MSPVTAQGHRGRILSPVQPRRLRLMFAPADLLFYGIAVYEGYQFSFKRVPEA